LCYLIRSNTEVSDWFEPEELIKIKGVSNITANAFKKGILAYNNELIGFARLPIKISYIKSPTKEILGNKCEGQKICFTGVRSVAAEEFIKTNGGEVVSGVSKTTTLLIVPDLEDKTLSSSKAVKAKQLGIAVQTLKEFEIFMGF